MSRTQKIRQSVDGALDRWQARAEAVESHLHASKDEAMEKVEASKQAYLRTIDKVKAEVAKSKTIADSEKQRLQQNLDEARVKVALGKADTVDEFNKQRDALKTELANVEKKVDAELAAFDDKADETLDRLARDLVKAADAFDAEMDAAAAKLHSLKEKVSVDFDANAEKVKSNVAAFKTKIGAKREDASTNAQAFESEFSEGWHQIVASFKNLK